MEYKNAQSERVKENKEDILKDIRDALRDWNRIEWLKAMIAYSDEPEKYRKLLESMYELPR